MSRLEHCFSHHESNPNPINPKLTDIPESGPIFGLFLLTMKGTVKNNLNVIILSLKRCPAQNFQPLSPLGRQSIWDVLVAVA